MRTLATLQLVRFRKMLFENFTYMITTSLDQLVVPEPEGVLVTWGHVHEDPFWDHFLLSTCKICFPQPQHVRTVQMELGGRAYTMSQPSERNCAPMETTRL